uniref:MIP34463p1 n=1 Tax=Drosophila melanogaster TaxID=7227 RepID=H1UUP4_DROME|nr:MIP34463p1 [Drosophila melanogaster]AOQ14528.1 CG43272-PA [synthetic construct]
MSSLEGTAPPSELPPCAAGFTWVILMSTCLPDLARTKSRCVYGYYFNEKLKKCMRRRYDKEQKPGVIRQWMKATTKKPTTARGPCFQREQAYTGNWFGYNAGYGRNETRR